MSLWIHSCLFPCEQGWISTTRFWTAGVFLVLVCEYSEIFRHKYWRRSSRQVNIFSIWSVLPTGQCKHCITDGGERERKYWPHLCFSFIFNSSKQSDTDVMMRSVLREHKQNETDQQPLFFPSPLTSVRARPINPHQMQKNCYCFYSSDREWSNKPSIHSAGSFWCLCYFKHAFFATFVFCGKIIEWQTWMERHGYEQRGLRFGALSGHASEHELWGVHLKWVSTPHGSTTLQMH